MFVDLVGSTSLSGRLDPEDLRTVVLSYQARCVDAIGAHDGFVANYQGDGILAYFGFPIAHEEDALQAVRAGLRIVGEMPALAAELDIHDLSARVGVHTGLVVVGEMGAGASRVSADVVGETPNIAARVQSLAEPGQLVITGSTRALVDGFVTVEPLGTQSLRGVDQPVPLFVVSGETSAKSRLEAAGGRARTPLVGREAEMGVLLRCWEAARTGAGQVTVISGEPGIGKSRLVLELREHVKAEGGTVVGLRGSPRLRNSAMQPIIDHLRRATGIEHAAFVDHALDRIEELVSRSERPPAGAVDVIAEVLEVDRGVEHPRVPLGPEARRRRTLDALIGLLHGLADERDTLLICEDVQWFDPTTVDLMAELLAGDWPNGLLMVITQRSDHPLPWPPIDGAVALALSGLRTAQVDRVVAQLCGGRALPADLQRQIADRTDGVPLFVEEMTQMLLDVSADAATGTAALARTVPSTLRDLLMARLDRQGQAIEVAQLAATFGREVSGEFLRTVWPGLQAELERGLEHLVASGLLQRQQGVDSVTYAFKHSLVQDVAYDSLLRTTRIGHHRVIAEVLVARPEARLNPEVVAHHFASAAMPERALQFWLLAGERALERSADREAVAHLTAGLELVPKLPLGRARDEKELTLLVRLGAPLMATRGYGSAEVEEVYRRALALGDALGDMTQLFEALYGIFRMHLLRAEYRIALDVADRLGALAARAEQPQLTVAASRAAGCVLVYRGDHKPEALRALQHAIATDARQRDTGPRGPALNDVADAGITSRAYAAWTLWLQGHTADANAMSDSAVDMARSLGHPFTLALALSFDSWLRQFQGDVAAVRTRADEVGRFAAEQGFAFWIGWAGIMGGWADGIDGDPAVAAADIRQGLVDWRATGSQLGTTYFLYLLADVLARAGEVTEALEILGEASTFAHETGEGFWLAAIFRLRGELLATMGDARSAEAELARALSTARHQGAEALITRAAEVQDHLVPN
jgi:class 3 adenylate cyclase/predicted ATPase